MSGKRGSLHFVPAFGENSGWDDKLYLIELRWLSIWRSPEAICAP
jgi:hypothetical protein